MINRLFGNDKKSSLWDDDEISSQRDDNKKNRPFGMMMNVTPSVMIMNHSRRDDDKISSLGMIIKKIIPLG